MELRITLGFKGVSPQVLSDHSDSVANLLTRDSQHSYCFSCVQVVHSTTPVADGQEELEALNPKPYRQGAVIPRLGRPTFCLTVTKASNQPHDCRIIRIAALGLRWLHLQPFQLSVTPPLRDRRSPCCKARGRCIETHFLSELTSASHCSTKGSKPYKPM